MHGLHDGERRTEDEGGMTKALPADRVEALNLIHHGTKPSSLTARNIIQAAEADLRSLEFNAELKRLRAELRSEGLPTKHTGPARRYSFLRAHVTGSKTPAQIIAAAIEGHADGAGSSDIATARIYSDLDLLKAALDALEAA